MGPALLPAVAVPWATASSGHQALHIPDGLLSAPVAVVFWLVTIAFVVLATRRVGESLDDRLVPLMGVMAAFIFAAQMINFPVAGGTSGHLLGGALAAILLGPWAGILVMTAVIGLQALLFQDGGLLAMGANIFNMGILTAIVGFGLYRAAPGAAARGRGVVVAAAAWLSVMAAAFVTSLQLWLSGTSSLQLVLPAMLGVHALIGIGEALITVGAVAIVARSRADLVDPSMVASRGGRRWVALGAVVVAAVLVLAPYASIHPDGLERVAEDQGFLALAQGAPYEVLPDYTIPFLGATSLSTILAGAAGALLVGLFMAAVGRRLRSSAAAGP